MSVRKNVCSAVKMPVSLYLLFIFFPRVVAVTMEDIEECSITNLTCKNIQNGFAGFNFPLEPGNKSKPVIETEINQNGTPIATLKGGKCDYSAEVTNCDNKSITTRTCGSIHVKYIYEEEGGKISESCHIYSTTGSDDSTGFDGISSVVITVVTISVIVLVVLAVLKVLGLIKCRKKTTTDAAARSGNSDSESTEENNRNYREEEQQRQLLNGERDDVNLNFIREDQNGNMGHDPGGGKADTTLHSNGNVKYCAVLILDETNFNVHNSPLSSCRSAQTEAFDETAGDKGQELVDSEGPDNKSNDPPDGEKDAHREARIKLNTHS